MIFVISKYQPKQPKMAKRQKLQKIAKIQAVSEVVLDEGSAESDESEEVVEQNKAAIFLKNPDVLKMNMYLRGKVKEILQQEEQQKSAKSFIVQNMSN